MCDTCENDYEVMLAKHEAEKAEYEHLLDLNIVDKNGNKIRHNDKLRCKFGLSDKLFCDAIFKVVIDPFGGLELQFVKLANDDPMNQTWFNLSVLHNYISRSWSEEHKKPCLRINERYGENHNTRHRWLQQQESFDIEIFRG